MEIELIKTISYVAFNKIIDYQSAGPTKVIVDADWTDLPIHVASSKYSSSSREDAAGTSYTTNITARLKESVGVIPHSILKIELCSGRVLILGTPYIPVKSFENISLSIINFNINYTGVSAPLELV